MSHLTCKLQRRRGWEKTGSVAHMHGWVSKASELTLHPLCKYATPHEDKTQPVMLLQLSQHDVQGFSTLGPSQRCQQGAWQDIISQPSQNRALTLLLGVGC